ncbi:unnamed protein product [Ectocarpus sp. CCAP 1310/34]|nr:unnamed protein product [Ectocarpus sp. CCAP 1310/34]
MLYRGLLSFDDRSHRRWSAGTIPKELGNLAALVTLWLSNRLEGPIPQELGNLENLQQLCLSENQLTGPIPKELGNLASLVVLLLASNELEGSIPPELVNLGILYQCDMSNNRLQGIITKELVARLGPMLLVHGNQLTVDWDKSPATDGGGWQNRLEPYSNISIIATLFAGVGLAIFPLPRSNVPEGHGFLLGLTGHVVYNFLMCCSFSTNMLVALFQKERGPHNGANDATVGKIDSGTSDRMASCTTESGTRQRPSPQFFDVPKAETGFAVSGMTHYPDFGKNVEIIAEVAETNGRSGILGVRTRCWCPPSFTV